MGASSRFAELRASTWKCVLGPLVQQSLVLPLQKSFLCRNTPDWLADVAALLRMLCSACRIGDM